MFHRHHESYIVADDPASYATPIVQPAFFWCSSRKDIIALRKKFLFQWVFSSVQLWILIFLVSAIYFGTGHNPSQYTNRIDVAIVDYDGDLASYSFLNAFRQSTPGNLTLNWLYKDASDYNGNIDEAQREVENGKVWAMVILRSNTTLLANQTLSTFINTTTSLTSPFASTPAVIVIYEDGRNSFTENNYVLPPIRTALATASARYGQILRTQLTNGLSSSSNSSVNRASQLSNTFKLGSLLVDPLAASYQNLHPAFPFVGLYFSS
jgi:hypothetical protein